MTGAELIAAERQRQQDAEGWTPEHDDEHDLSELTRAALVYAKLASLQACDPDAPIPPDPQGWPWRFYWWKPSHEPIGNLVKAGALIAAEIDRIQRRAGRGR